MMKAAVPQENGDGTAKTAILLMKCLSMTRTLLLAEAKVFQC
jgi:hypothetical protein